MRPLVLLSVCVLFCLAGDTPRDGKEQSASNGVKASHSDECREIVPCVAKRCIPVPTSLQPVGNQPDPDGWRGPADGDCGIRRCYVIWFCGCGPPLATEACL